MPQSGLGYEMCLAGLAGVHNGGLARSCTVGSGPCELSFTLKREGFAEAPNEPDDAPGRAELSCFGFTARKNRCSVVSSTKSTISVHDAGLGDLEGGGEAVRDSGAGADRAADC